MKNSKRWCYYCTQRPAYPGAIPRGVIDIEEMDPDVPIKEIGKGAYNLIKYDRELTNAEIYQYELTWAWTEVTG